MDDTNDTYVLKNKVDFTLKIHPYIGSMSSIDVYNVVEGMVSVNNLYFYTDFVLCMDDKLVYDPINSFREDIYEKDSKGIRGKREKIKVIRKDKQKGIIEDKFEWILKRPQQIWRFITQSTISAWSLWMLKTERRSKTSKMKW